MRARPIARATVVIPIVRHRLDVSSHAVLYPNALCTGSLQLHYNLPLQRAQFYSSTGCS